MDWLSSISAIFDPRKWEEDDEDSYVVQKTMNSVEPQLRTVSSHASENRPMSVGSMRNVSAPQRRVSTTAGNVKYTSVGSYTPTAPGQSDAEIAEKEKRLAEARDVLESVKNPKPIITNDKGESIRDAYIEPAVMSVAAATGYPGQALSRYVARKQGLDFPENTADPEKNAVQNLEATLNAPGSGAMLDAATEGFSKPIVRYNPLTIGATLAGKAYAGITGEEDPVEKLYEGAFPYTEAVRSFGTNLAGDLVTDPGSVIGMSGVAKGLRGAKSVGSLERTLTGLESAQGAVQARRGGEDVVENVASENYPEALKSGLGATMGVASVYGGKKANAVESPVRAPSDFATVRAGGLGGIDPKINLQTKAGLEETYFKDVSPQIKKKVFEDAKSGLLEGKSPEEIISRYPEDIRNEVASGVRNLEDSINTQKVFKEAADSFYPELEKQNAWTRQIVDTKSGDIIKILDRPDGKAADYYAIDAKTGKLIGASGYTTDKSGVRSISNIYKEDFLNPEARSSGSLYRAMRTDNVKSNLETGQLGNLSPAGKAAAERYQNENIRKVTGPNKTGQASEIQSISGERSEFGSPSRAVKFKEGVRNAGSVLLENVDKLLGPGGGFFPGTIKDISEEGGYLSAKDKADYDALLKEIDESPEMAETVRIAKEGRAGNVRNIVQEELGADAVKRERVRQQRESARNIVAPDAPVLREVKSPTKSEKSNVVYTPEQIKAKESADRNIGRGVTLATGQRGEIVGSIYPQTQDKAGRGARPAEYKVRLEDGSEIFAHPRAMRLDQYQGPNPPTKQELAIAERQKASEIRQQAPIKKSGSGGKPPEPPPDVIEGTPEKKRSWLEEQVREAALFPRMIKTAFDLSAVGRQGLTYTTDPKNWTKKNIGTAIPEMLKSFTSKEKFEAFGRELEKNPNYDLAKSSGLELTDPLSLDMKEENFQSKWAEKIPGIAGSERAFTAFMNKARLDLLDQFTTGMKDKDGVINLPSTDAYKVRFSDGKTYTVLAKTEAEARQKLEKHAGQRTFDSIEQTKYYDPKDKNVQQYKAAIKVVNNLTGRGDIRGLTDSTLAQATLFSPKFTASRINLLTEGPKYATSLLTGKDYGMLSKMDPESRKAVLAHTARSVGVITSVAGAAFLTTDTEPEEFFNPQSTNFGKLKQGSTTVDLSAGFGPYIKLAAQLGTGEKYTARGDKLSLHPEKKKPGAVYAPGSFKQERQLNRGAEVQGFTRSRLSPWAGLASDALIGQNPYSPQQPFDAKRATSDFIAPMSGANIYSAAKYENDPLARYGGPAADVFGFGSNVLEPRKEKKKKSSTYSSPR